MSQSAAQHITIDHLCTATGLGPKQARADVRAGLLPGRMRDTKHGSTYVCSPGEYQRWLDGDWTPRPQPQPVTLLHKRAS